MTDRWGRGIRGRWRPLWVVQQAAFTHCMLPCILATRTNSEVSRRPHRFMQGICFHTWKVVWDNVIGGKTFLTYKYLSILSGVQARPAICRDWEGHPLPLLHLSQRAPFQWKLDLVLVRLYSFCHAAAVFPFDSASATSKTEKELFQVMWFGCRRANGLSWIGKRKPFWEYVQEHPVISRTRQTCTSAVSPVTYIFFILSGNLRWWGFLVFFDQLPSYFW